MDELLALRQDIFKMACCGGAGHLASSFSCVEILYALYFGGVMRYSPQMPEDPARDYFILSKGHGALAYYAVLARAGFFPREALWQYLKPGQMLGGEPLRGDIPGVEAATGSLGHGLSLATGIAYALRTEGAPNRVFALLGDGECQEGSIWEAAISAAHLGLEHLTLVLDHNRLQKVDTVEALSSVTNFAERFRAFGWDVAQVDGHDVAALSACLQQPGAPGRPRAVIAHTIKGKGVGLMENETHWHYRMPNRKERAAFLAALSLREEDLTPCR